MKRSFIVYTNNSQKYISKLLQSILEQMDETEEQLVIVDDLSTDGTMPEIVATVGYNFIDEEHFKLYINNEPIGKKASIEKAKKIATGDFKFIINKKGRVKIN